MEIAELVLRGGADVNATTTDAFVSWNTRHAKGKTLLEMALRHRHDDVASLLGRHGAIALTPTK